MEDSIFEIEPLFARGRSVCTLDMGLQVARVPFGPECGLTDAQARGWAALLAQAPALYAFVKQQSDAGDNDATSLIAQCQPKAKGLPFKNHNNQQEDRH